MWGFAIVRLMEKAGMDLNPDTIGDLVEGLGFPVAKAKQDIIQYKDTMEKAAQAEQLFREIEIREKKKMAERLERKAQVAMDAAKAAETAPAEAQ